jgi:hypothetical protein
VAAVALQRHIGGFQRFTARVRPIEIGLVRALQGSGPAAALVSGTADPVRPQDAFILRSDNETALGAPGKLIDVDSRAAWQHGSEAVSIFCQ